MTPQSQPHLVNDYFGELVGVHYAADARTIEQLTTDSPGLDGAAHAFVARTIYQRLTARGLRLTLLNGQGDLAAGLLNISFCDVAAALPVLRELLENFPSPLPDGKPVNLLRHCHIAWHDKANDIFRTFYPATTRPFWTLLESPERVQGLLARGHSMRRPTKDQPE